MKAITDHSDAELVDLVVRLGGKPFQARQLAHWTFRHRAETWQDCRNLPAALLDHLGSELPLRRSRILEQVRAKDDTVKLLLELDDQETVESVLIPEGERTTLCISTQVGCPVACVFCASGLNGVRRNLSPGEIVEQVLHAQQALPRDRKITNLVVMGIGEPMLNLDNLLPALERIHDPEGINLGARRITVSTSGYPDRIARFAAVPHAYNLAVSLHAADDELRRRLVPTQTCSVAELVGAARRYLETTGRRPTFEVVLLARVNDRPGDAEVMVRALKGFPCSVNLLPWNPVEQIPEFERPSPRRVEEFAARLRTGGINVTVRRQRGADRSAACGQLRIRSLEANEG